MVRIRLQRNDGCMYVCRWICVCGHKVDIRLNSFIQKYICKYHELTSMQLSLENMLLFRDTWIYMLHFVECTRTRHIFSCCIMGALFEVSNACAMWSWACIRCVFQLSITELWNFVNMFHIRIHDVVMLSW